MILCEMTYMGVVAYTLESTGREASGMGDGLVPMVSHWHWGACVALTRTWAVRKLYNVFVPLIRKES